MVGERGVELTKTVASDCDLVAELSLPGDCKIASVGERILAANPTTNNLVVPTRFIHHPFVENSYFFTLPGPLLDHLSREVAFDKHTLEFERTLSDICGDHSTICGFWNGRALGYDLLRAPKRWRPLVEDAAAVGWNISQDQLDETMELLEERSDSFRQTARAYTGWLISNQKFLDEQKTLLTQWSSEVRQEAQRRLGSVFLDGSVLPDDAATTDEEWSRCRNAFEAFYARWRLADLAAPFLPVPLRPLMSGNIPISVMPQVNRANGAFCYPDTFPVKMRAIRGVVEDALHGSDSPAHLQQWMNLVSGENTAKKSLQRFARLFEVQHYWRILHQRHEKSIERRLGKVKFALAEFLGVSFDSIHRDLLFVKKRLGRGWYAREDALLFGPF
jgi:hypothetical protein